MVFDKYWFYYLLYKILSFKTNLFIYWILFFILYRRFPLLSNFYIFIYSFWYVIFLKKITFMFINKMFGVNSTLAVQLLCHVRLFVTRWITVRQASLSFTISWSLLKLVSIESVMPSKHLILCHPLLLPSIFPSIRVFSNESALHITWPKYRNVSFSISLDWFPLGLTGLNSFRSKGLSRVFSSTTVRKHQFFGARPCLWSNSHIHTWLEKP